jgi:hypothetical protein
MRIFNQDQLTFEIRTHLSTMFHESAFARTHEQEFISWLNRAWSKHFIKSRPDSFVWPVRVKKLPAFFKTSSTVPPTLEVVLPSGNIELEPQSEWDIKDAEAGTLFYFSSCKTSLTFFYEEINDVRDYVYSLIESGDRRYEKYGYADVQRAGQKWHEQKQRELRARLEAEAAMRAANDAARYAAVPRWDFLSQPKDWDFAVPEPILIKNEKYLLIRLLSQKALDYESYVMEHCVHTYGRHLYDKAPERLLISVRALDSAHLPLVTVEVQIWPHRIENTSVIQVRGKHNHDAEQTIPGIRLRIEELKRDLAKSAWNRPQSKDLSYRV